MRKTDNDSGYGLVGGAPCELPGTQVQNLCAEAFLPALHAFRDGVEAASSARLRASSTVIAPGVEGIAVILPTRRVPRRLAVPRS
jgi:hypothetical protein